MGFYERIDARGVRETGRPVSFIPKGALTHHPEGAVVLPAATVRSARRMRLLREPYGQCHITAVLLSLATQSAMCFASSSNNCFQNGNNLPPACENLPPVALSQRGCRNSRHPFLFAKKKQKRICRFSVSRKAKGSPVTGHPWRER